MKIVYAGTPEFSIKPLESLLKAGYEISAVITQPDKPQGRKGILTAPPLKQFALRCKLPVYQFEKISKSVNELRSIGADLLITCAYGQILSQELLDSFAFGVYNIHASLLPKYRGASPIQCALLNGDRVTGITIMRTERGVDTGKILLSESLEVFEEDNAQTLAERLSVLGAECIVKAIPLIVSGASLKEQNEKQATLCGKLDKQGGQINFNNSYSQINNLVRAYNPVPAAYALLDGTSYNIFKVTFVDLASLPEVENDLSNGSVLFANKNGLIVKCSDGALRIDELQASGGKRMLARDFINGNKIKRGQKFSYKTEN